MQHIPVLLNEVLTEAHGLKPGSLRFFDGTFGRGGHSRALLDQFPGSTLVAMDRDLAAIEHAKDNFKTEIQQGRLQIVHGNYADFDLAQLGRFDFMLLDLGVSSPQLDQGERGFSFYHDGPLDMRMDQSQGFTAEDYIADLPEKELIRIFKEYGEIYSPFRVVRALVHDRKTKRFSSTKDLAGLIERVDGWKVKGVHPATKYFMALRMLVNQELEGVSEALPKLREALNLDGRLVIITFHSLEDRLVKNDFKNSPEMGFPVHKKVIQAGEEELKINSRARSAKLRVFQKGKQQGSYAKRGPKTT